MIFGKRWQLVLVTIGAAALAVWFGFMRSKVAVWKMPRVERLVAPEGTIPGLYVRAGQKRGALLVAFELYRAQPLWSRERLKDLTGFENDVLVYRFSPGANQLERVAADQWTSAPGEIAGPVGDCTGTSPNGLWVDSGTRKLLWRGSPSSVEGRTIVTLCGAPPTGQRFAVLSAAGSYRNYRFPMVATPFSGTSRARGPRFHQIIELRPDGPRLGPPAVLNGTSERLNMHAMWSPDGAYVIYFTTSELWMGQCRF